MIVTDYFNNKFYFTQRDVVGKRYFLSKIESKKTLPINLPAEITYGDDD